MFIFLPIIFSYILLLLHLCQSEYHISENDIPSYLYKSLNGLSEDIFPNDIKMSMSVSRMEGTLLYSIDSNGNQLILSLSKGATPTLTIEFSKQTFYTSLSELCGCERCTHEKITLRIQMKEDIYLQCNGGMTKAHKYKRSKEFNEDYPVIKFNKTSKLEARLWLVNTPRFEDLYPNGAQLYGCIFHVWYNNELLKMDSLGVGDTCNITCTPGICHSGSCLETYNYHPFCNCTSSFKNGQFCNEEAVKENFWIYQKGKFKAIKLSFNNLSGDFFEINNRAVFLNLVTIRTELRIIINISSKKHIKIEATISKKYNESNENIIILEFEETYLNVKFSGYKSSWTLILIPLDQDLSREIFEYLKIQSGNGTIEMVFKDDLKELKWNKLSFSSNKTQIINIQSLAKIYSVMIKESFKSLKNVSNKKELNIQKKEIISPEQMLLSLKLRDLDFKVFSCLVMMSCLMILFILLSIIMGFLIYKKEIYSKKKNEKMPF